jgi:ribonuclease E
VRSVSSVALQLLRGLEEILMKGATHNLVVRTRTDVALYVLNHKRGHLRDLESSFKVTLAVIADPSVSGQQSFIIDRGEQVHTLEAAKALLATQAATAAAMPEEPYEDDEVLDSEFESEVETEETEGLAEDVVAGEAVDGEQEGPRRKRRRRRRGRTGEPREGVAPRDGEANAPTLDAGAVTEVEAQPDDSESEEDETDEQPNVARADQAAGGERRPRRRGRRGGRRRRGGPEDGLAGSITDELTPPADSEAQEAVADFDGYTSSPTVPDDVQPEPMESAAPAPVAPAPEPALAVPPPLAAVPAPAPETAEDSEKAARRRSTVREKVTFLAEAPSAAAAPAHVSPAEQPAPSAAPKQPTAEPAATDSANDGQPRRAGWWSRRFGSGD